MPNGASVTVRLLGWTGAALLGLVGLYYGVILGTFGGAWSEYFLGGPGILLGILLTTIPIVVAAIFAGRAIGRMIGSALVAVVSRSRSR